MSEEARKTLETLALHKHAVLKNIVTDDYGRQLADVLASQTFLNSYMVTNGFARSSGEYKDVQDTAKTRKLGIWSDACRKTSNPDCSIKGNRKNGAKTFHLPDCKNYDQTIVDESYGDQWFCTEKEALAAGFSKASGCNKN